MPVSHASIDSLLARGNAYTVWLARDDRDRTIALKIPLDDPDILPAAELALERERGALSLIRHRHVVRVLGTLAPGAVEGWTEAVPQTDALALEYLPGGNLESLAGQHPKHWVRAAFELISVLECMHGLDIVHGDVKARNVLFDTRERARLIDFSCAARIGDRFSKRFGTEQYQRNRQYPHIVDSDDDLYAFAVLLYELLTGSWPARADPPGDEAGRESAPPAHERMNFTRKETVLLDVILGKLGTPAAAPGPDLDEFRAALGGLVAD